MGCWFRKLDGEHDQCVRPFMVRCHLIPQHKILKAFRKGAVWIDGHWQPMIEARFLPDDLKPETRTLKELQDDPRSWRSGCGGYSGLAGHHGRLDNPVHDRNKLIVPRALIPADVEEYAEQLGLTTVLDHLYGLRA